MCLHRLSSRRPSKPRQASPNVPRTTISAITQFPYLPVIVVLKVLVVVVTVAVAVQAVVVGGIVIGSAIVANAVKAMMPVIEVTMFVAQFIKKLEGMLSKDQPYSIATERCHFHLSQCQNGRRRLPVWIRAAAADGHGPHFKCTMGKVIRNNGQWILNWSKDAAVSVNSHG